jgi:uncharacterized protein
MSLATNSHPSAARGDVLPVALQRIEAYPPGLGRDVALIQTHISWVFLLERHVFKVRRPVDLGFVDFSSVEQRHADCQAEVRLNAPLAADVYEGVVPIWLDEAQRVRVGVTPRGPIIDWAVQMRRLPEADRADVLLAKGSLNADAVEAIAVRIARFHAELAVQPAATRFGTVDEILRNVEDNFSATRESLGRYLDERQSEELMAAQRQFLTTHRDLISERVVQGRVRETHGDLRLEHVYLEPGGTIRVLDCVEFSERFRVADVAADIAFLSMDLSRLGHPELAEVLLAAYAREACDYELFQLVDFYQSYRAFVRGKIAALVAEDDGTDHDTRDRAAQEARRCFLLALASERPSVVRPMLLAVGGAIATGKSTIAELLGRTLPAVVISTDRTRKELAGVSPTTELPHPAWSGAYSPQFTERVYSEVLHRAALVLRSGRPVVLDASFRSRAARARARALAHEHQAAFRFVECRAPEELCHARLDQRARGPSVSDGRREIHDAFRGNFEPVDELPATEHYRLDTSLPGPPAIGPLLQGCPSWPRVARPAR